jgi:hypothetical protein
MLVRQTEDKLRIDLMRNLYQLIGIAITAASLYHAPASSADDSSNLYYQFTLSLEGTRLDNLSLGDDPDVDRLETQEYELEMELEYSLTDRAYLFLDLSLKDDTEEVKPRGERETERGLERKQMGVAVNFGEEIATELKIGRMEFINRSEWWVWWDEELDAVSVESNFASFTGMLAIAEEQARESTDVDDIDPEMEDVRRILASLSWDYADDQSLILYYLDQTDNSGSVALEDLDKGEVPDEVDADLSWNGISYLGGFELDSVGEINIELHYSTVRGDETLTEFDDGEGDDEEGGDEEGGDEEGGDEEGGDEEGGDEEGGDEEGGDEEGGDEEGGEIETEKRSVSGDAYSYLISWTPAALDDWTFILGGARGDESFQQTGLQGDSEVFGELYQPEISNMSVQALGVAWQVARGYELVLFGYDYRQLTASEDMRDVSIELDPNGIDRDLGREIDLVLIVDAIPDVELVLIAAEFEAGDAYGEREGERSQYFSIELDYFF